MFRSEATLLDPPTSTSPSWHNSKMPVPCLPITPPLTPPQKSTIRPATASSLSDLFKDIRIPSPLLYHKETNTILDLPDDSLEEDRVKAFLLTCNNARSALVPVAEQDTAMTSTPLASDQHFNPANLPILKSHLKNDYQSIPQPPWVIPLDKGTLTVPQPGRSLESSPDGSVVRFFNDSLSESTRRLVDHLGYPTTTDLRRSKSWPAQEATSTVGGSVIQHLGLSENAHGNITTTLDLIDDNSEVLDRMWQALDARSYVDRSKQSRYDFTQQQVVDQGSPEECINSDNDRSLSIDIAACPTSNCTALVPARLFQHQYIGWPKWNVAGFAQTSYPILGAVLPKSKQLTGMDGLLAWLRDLGLEQQHTPKCNASAAEGSQSNILMETFGLDQLFQECDDEGRPETSEQVIQPMDDSDEETFYSLHESEQEIDPEEGQRSEDEWADFDWDWEMEWEEPLSLAREKQGAWNSSAAW